MADLNLPITVYFSEQQNDFGADQEVAEFLGGRYIDGYTLPPSSSMSSDSVSSMDMLKDQAFVTVSFEDREQYKDATKTIKSENMTPVSDGSHDNDIAHYPSLQFLAAQGEIVKLKEEIKKGVNMNVVDKQGLTPLMWAAAHRQKAVTKLLLENQTDPNIEGLGGESALLFASTQGQSDIIDQLLQHGADINHADLNGGTALMYAVFGNFAEIVRKLLENGADMTAKNENDETCYSLATSLGNKAVIKVIEDYIKNILENPVP